MDINYNLVGAYSPKNITVEELMKQASHLFESSYIEKRDITELAKETDSVLLVEEEAEDGNMEFIIATNKGRIKTHEVFSFELVNESRYLAKRLGPENHFTKKMLKDIDKLVDEYEMTREEFIEEYLSAYYMDLYEEKKNNHLDKLKDYYKE